MKDKIRRYQNFRDITVSYSIEMLFVVTLLALIILTPINRGIPVALFGVVIVAISVKHILDALLSIDARFWQERSTNGNLLKERTGSNAAYYALMYLILHLLFVGFGILIVLSGVNSLVS